MKKLVILAILAAWVGCSDDGSDVDGAVSDSATNDATPDQGVDLPDCSGGGTVIPSQWIDLEPGDLTMGSPAAEACREGDESSHAVSLTRAFEISDKEVTQRQFEALVGHNPAFHQQCGLDCPVEWVSWHEAAAYCNALSEAASLPPCYSCEGCGAATRCTVAASAVSCLGYRLPTEAEWEYAARAGTSTPLYNGEVGSCMGASSTVNAIGWYKANSGGTPHPVGLKQANDWGLYDMSGNVYEWTNDWYQPSLEAASDPIGPASGSERVFKGGSWYHNAEHARSASRERFRPDKRFTFVGFRCVRSTGE